MELRVWQSFSCNNSSSYYVVARFQSDKEAALIAGEIDKFLHTHAKQRDGTEDWEAPTKVMAEVEKSWGFKFGKNPYIDWGGGGGMVGDEPVVGVTGTTAVFYHGYCGGLDFISTMVKARGGTVLDQSDGDLTVGAMLEVADNSAGKTLAKKLGTFFEQSAPNLEDWQPGPWKKKKAKRYSMPYAEVEDILYWTDGKHIGFELPFNADELGELKSFCEGQGVADFRISICGTELREKLRKLMRIGSCLECGSNAITLFEADDSMPEDQLVCGACQGMFGLSTMVASSPIQNVGQKALLSICAVDDSLFALARSGALQVKTATAKKWRKVGAKNNVNVHFLHTTDGKNMVAAGMDGLFVSNNGGKSWTKKKLAMTKAFAATASPNGTLFAGGGEGYSGGTSGGIARSTNGGKKWEALKVKTNAIIFGIAAASDDVLYACTGNGKILRTKNGGKTWKASVSGSKRPLCRIVARSETSAVAVGDGGVIVTTNDGQKWTSRKSGVDADIEDIIVGNDNRLYAVTSTGDILVSTTGAKWEKHRSGARTHLWGLATTPSGTLVCVGDDGFVVRVRGLDVATTEDDTEVLPTVDRSFAFTGKLRGLSRSDAETRAAQLGGTVKSSVTKDLDYLVIGDEGSPLFGGGKKGAKMLKAEKLIADGASLRIISEARFSRLNKAGDGGGEAKAKATAKAKAKPKANASAKAKATAKAKPKSAAKPKQATKKTAAKSKGSKAKTTEGKSFLFTGKLSAMSRGEAKKRVAELGGVSKSSVTKDLDYLVIGDEGSPLFGGGKKGAKMLKGEKLIAEGAPLRIISESDFLKLKRK